jgi:Xaa-Pro aminopeptidase
MDVRTSPFRMRLAQLREELARRGVDALLVPSSDPHLSEYLPERWQGRAWLSGFTGSMGTLVIGSTKAALFADSRYWVQAQAQLHNSGIELVRIDSAHAPAHLDWLAAQVPRGGHVAVDGQVIGLQAATALKKRLDAAGISLRTDADLLDAVWPDRPALPAQPAYAHRAPHASRSRATKLALVRETMARHGATHHFISTVDDVAWLTNLRGSDVEYNPVFLAHLLLDATGGRLFVDAAKLDATLRAELAADGIELAPYDQAAATLAGLRQGDTLLLDPKRVTLGFRESVAGGCQLVEAINPSTLLKSRKTAEEAQCVREAMAEDGAALCEFYADFEAALARGERVTELDVETRLQAARARRKGFIGPSFSTIAGFAANGAMPHYRALPESFSVIEGNSLLLIDSGAQYLGGTTDITRVWPIGPPSAAMKRDYTLVLKGTMALSRTRFPRGTLSPMLDAIARAPLWAEGLDFGHGTGHGVGYFLNVHEGPHSISRTIPDAHMAMEPGMITSIEPGVYRTGQWGVRIENLVLNVPADTPEGNTFAEMLEFETLTLCPIDTTCVERSLLRADEIGWLNAYHATVLQRLAPRVDGDALAWLQRRCVPI